MQRYGDYRPTGFDPAGAFLDDDRQDWLVVPVGQTRDSGPFSQSNFETAQKILTNGREDADDFEVHRFGHWGPGWFEIIIVRPDSRAAELAQGIEDRLADYPLLDDEDHSRREWEEYERSWESWGRRDLVREIVKQFELSDRAELLLEDGADDVLFQWWNDGANYPSEPDGDGVTIPVDRVGDWFDRSQVAGLLRQLRSA